MQPGSARVAVCISIAAAAASARRSASIRIVPAITSTSHLLRSGLGKARTRLLRAPPQSARGAMRDPQRNHTTRPSSLRTNSARWPRIGSGSSATMRSGAKKAQREGGGAGGVQVPGRGAWARGSGADKGSVPAPPS